LYHDRVMPRAKKSSTTWPFPFFGAGEASYFEWAEVHVLFTREPSKTEKRKIKQNVPLALRDSFDWEGPALMVASDQFAHVAIAEQFARDDDDDDDEDEDDDDDDDDEGRWFFASSAAVTRFNEATEAWLREAHEVCPILLAFRREDGESGGTELSDWHDWSVRSLPELLPALRELMQTNSDSHRAYLLRGVLDMGSDAKIALPDDLLAWLERVRIGLDDGSRDADDLAQRAYDYILEKRWADAIALFEMVLDRPDLAVTGYSNALYAVMHDNNGLPIDRDRHLHFIAAALPHGPANPSIFYNAACVYMELGETDRVLDNLALALEHGFDQFDLIREEALLTPLRGDARFIALLDSMPSKKKKAAKKKAAKKKAAKKKR
jgi:tetratricopeptide (TPR) repeat protein